MAKRKANAELSLGPAVDYQAIANLILDYSRSPSSLVLDIWPEHHPENFPGISKEDTLYCFVHGNVYSGAEKLWTHVFSRNAYGFLVDQDDPSKLLYCGIAHSLDSSEFTHMMRVERKSFALNTTDFIQTTHRLKELGQKGVYPVSYVTYSYHKSLKRGRFSNVKSPVACSDNDVPHKPESTRPIDADMNPSPDHSSTSTDAPLSNVDPGSRKRGRGRPKKYQIQTTFSSLKTGNKLIKDGNLPSNKKHKVSAATSVVMKRSIKSSNSNKKSTKLPIGKRQSFEQMKIESNVSSVDKNVASTSKASSHPSHTIRDRQASGSGSTVSEVDSPHVGHQSVDLGISPENLAMYRKVKAAFLENNPKRMDRLPNGHLIFAKIRGFPWWPAKIIAQVDTVHKKTKKDSTLFHVHFFATNEEAQIYLPDVIPYKCNRMPYAFPRAQKSFNLAVYDAEKHLREHGEVMDMPMIDDDDDLKSDEEGQLVIDTKEGEGLPWCKEELPPEPIPDPPVLLRTTDPRPPSSLCEYKIDDQMDEIDSNSPPIKLKITLIPKPKHDESAYRCDKVS